MASHAVRFATVWDCVTRVDFVLYGCLLVGILTAVTFVLMVAL